MGKHRFKMHQGNSFEEHMDILEENLQWSKRFLKNPVMRKICKKINSGNCETCEMIKKNIPEVKLLSSFLSVNTQESPPSENGPSSSKEPGTASSNHESTLAFSSDTPIASSSKSYHQNSRNSQKKSNIYPPTYIKFLEKKFHKRIIRIKKTVLVGVRNHLKMFPPKKSDKSCSSNMSRKIENEWFDYVQRRVSDFDMYESEPFTKYYSPNILKRYPEIYSNLMDRPKSLDLTEKHDSAGWRGSDWVTYFVDSNPGESKSSLSIASEVNEKGRGRECSRWLVSKKRNSKPRRIAMSVRKRFGPREISRAKKNPKLQPYVKLVDICKIISHPIVSQEKFKTVNNSSMMENNSTEGENVLCVPTNNSVSAFETSGEINLVAEATSTCPVLVTEELCSEEAERSSAKTMKSKHDLSSDKERDKSQKKRRKIGDNHIVNHISSLEKTDVDSNLKKGDFLNINERMSNSVVEGSGLSLVDIVESFLTSGKTKLRTQINSDNELNSIDVKKCFGSSEIHQIKKSPKIQPYVRLIDINKCDAIVPQEEKSKSNEAMASFSATENVFTQCEKMLNLPTNNSVPSPETNEEMNLVSEIASTEAEHIAEELCSDGAEAEHITEEPCSDETEAEHIAEELFSDETETEHIAEEPCSDETEAEHTGEELCLDETEAEHIAEKLCSDETEAEHITEEPCSDETEAEHIAEQLCSDETEAEHIAEEPCSDETEAEHIAEKLCSDETEAEHITEEPCSDETEAEHIAEQLCSDETETEHIAEEPCSDETETEHTAEELCLDETEAEHIAEKLCSDETEAEHLAEEPCSSETIKVDQCSDKTMDADQCSDETMDAYQCSDTSMDADQYSDETMDADQCSDETMNADQCSDETMDADQCSDETIEVDQCSDKTIKVELSLDKEIKPELEGTDPSLAQGKDNSEKSIHEIQECSFKEELTEIQNFSSEENKENNDADQKRTDLPFAASRALHSNVEREEVLEKNKKERSTDSGVEISDLSMEATLETDRNFLLGDRNSFLDDNMEVNIPLIYPASPEFEDGILTPKSPPAADRYPSMDESCSNFVPNWARFRSPSPYRRGPRTPPGVPRSPEGEEVEEMDQVCEGSSFFPENNQLR